LYDHHIFEAVNAITAARGEPNSDAHQYLLGTGTESGTEITGWGDTGKPEDLLEARRLRSTDPRAAEAFRRPGGRQVDIAGKVILEPARP
jgi:dTDP-glucose pyrophosphorylase